MQMEVPLAASASSEWSWSQIWIKPGKGRLEQEQLGGKTVAMSNDAHRKQQTCNSIDCHRRRQPQTSKNGTENVGAIQLNLATCI